MPVSQDDFRTGGALAWLEGTARQGDESLIGKQVGAYRLHALLGTGGMGSVFQASPVVDHADRDVAIKIFAPGLYRPGSEARFTREARIQGRLVHPNIAHLYDAGISDQGWPYLVMELVDGEPIDRYCEGRDLSVEHRLRLVLQVARAVAFAHANLVLHRDIKPGNVLVDRAGQPKLLDFGIAKLLDGEATAETAATRALTHGYASPEQIRGAAVTTASDVFQLGALLLAVLTGRPPFEDQSLERAFERATVDAPPALPRSDRLSGELRAVIGKCLAHDPADRYSDVNAFCDELQRYLDGYPVAARNPGLGTRTAKLLRRNPAASAAIASLVLVLLVGNVLYLQALTASRSAAQLEAEKASAVTEFLIGLFESNDPEQSSGETLTAAQLLDTGARRVDRQLASQPALHAEILTALGRIYFALRDFDASTRHFERALGIQSRLYGPEDPRLAEGYAGLARVKYELNSYNDEALEHYEKALRLHRAAHGEDAGYARLLSERAVLDMFVHERYEAALALLAEATAIQDRELPPEDPQRIFTLQQQLRAHERLGEFATAQRYGERAVALAEQAFGPEHPRVAASLFYLSRVLESQGRYGEAATAMEKVLAIDRTVYGEDDPRTADAYLNLAHMLRMSSALGKAIDAAERGVAAMGAARGSQNSAYATAVSVLAAARQEAGDYDTAEALHREALALFESVEGPTHSFTAYGLLLYGRYLAEVGRFEEAVTAHRRALDIWTAIVGPGKPDSAKVELALGQDYLWAGDLARAEPLILGALETHESALPADHLRLGDNLVALAELRTAQGRGGECQQAAEQGLAIRRGKLPESHLQVALAKAVLADCLLLAGAEHRGRQLFAEAREALADSRAFPAERLKARFAELAATSR